MSAVYVTNPTNTSVRLSRCAAGKNEACLCYYVPLLLATSWNGINVKASDKRHVSFVWFTKSLVKLSLLQSDVWKLASQFNWSEPPSTCRWCRHEECKKVVWKTTAKPYSTSAIELHRNLWLTWYKIFQEQPQKLQGHFLSQTQISKTNNIGKTWL